MENTNLKESISAMQLSSAKGLSAIKYVEQARRILESAVKEIEKNLNDDEKSKESIKNNLKRLKNNLGYIEDETNQSISVLQGTIENINRE